MSELVVYHRSRCFGKSCAFAMAREYLHIMRIRRMQREAEQAAARTLHKSPKV